MGEVPDMPHSRLWVLAEPILRRDRLVHPGQGRITPEAVDRAMVGYLYRQMAGCDELPDWDGHAAMCSAIGAQYPDLAAEASRRTVPAIEYSYRARVEQAAWHKAHAGESGPWRQRMLAETHEAIIAKYPYLADAGPSSHPGRGGVSWTHDRAHAGTACG